MKIRHLALVATTLVGLLALTTSPQQAAHKLEEGDPPKAGWQPDEPFDLSKEAPSDNEMRAAVYRAMDFIFEQQREDGSWDVVLSGAILSQTADDAVDSITATSMSCMALRNFVEFNPKRSEVAIRKGAEYVMSQILRGKLSNQVAYAIWRYSFGMRFLMGEYRLTEDQAYRDRLKGVCRRMMDSIIAMQKSNAEAEAVLKMVRKGDEGFATRSGIRCAPTGEGTVSGGAPVIFVERDSNGERAGVNAGDRIVAVGKTPIENTYDFLLESQDFIEGETVDIKVLRASDGATPLRLRMALKKVWPPDLGLRMRESQDGLVVYGYWPGAEAEAAGIAPDDIVFKVNNQDVKTLADVDAALAGKSPGDRVSIRFLQGEKQRKKSATVKMAARQIGWMGVYPDDEDKDSSTGAVIQALQPNGLAQKAGLLPQDRITHINNITIMGLDHYLSIAQTFWEGQEIKLDITRLVEVDEKGKALSAEDKQKRKEAATLKGEEPPQPIFQAERFSKMIRLTAFLRRGDLQFALSRNPQNGAFVVASVLKGGIAEKKGVKVDDRLISVNGEEIRSKEDRDRVVKALLVGDQAELLLERGNRKVKIKLPVVDSPPVINEEEGGWAYYPTKPHAPSFVTSAVILNFIEYEETFGKVSRRQDRDRRDALNLATKALMGLRVYDKEHKVYSYVYDIRGVTNENWINILGNVGRIMVGELAANKRGKIPNSRLRSALDAFFEYREELDKVRTYPITHYQARFNNAAYYWLFGHYYAAMAANEIGGSQRDKAHLLILKALMLKRNPDSTWVGHEGFGKLAGTTHALLILGQLKEMSWAKLPEVKRE